VIAGAAMCGCGDVAVLHHGDRPDAPLTGEQARSLPQGTAFAGLPSAPAASVVDGLRIRTLSEGADAKLGGLRGLRGTVVAFWATYCSACASELPGLQRIAPSLQRQGVRVLLVDLMESTGAARGWLEGHGIALPAYVDPDGSAHDGLRLLGVPATAVLGPDGSVKARLEGSADNAGLRDVLSAMGISAQ
jgi:thiol-disulfide isomerase/thioredoxin